MRIAILDDEPTQVTYINTVVKRWCDSKANLCIIDSFYSAEEFMFKYQESYPFDLLILDIQMKEINGMELAKDIRKTDKNVKIIFLTGIKDYVFEGYEVGAVRYLLKPINEEGFCRLLDEISRELSADPVNYLVFNYQGDNIKLSYADIIKIEVEGHYLRMTTVEREYIWKGSLSKIHEELKNESFIMANRSTFVNIMHIEKITKSECVMTEEISVPISRSNYKNINEAFINYYI